MRPYTHSARKVLRLSIILLAAWSAFPALAQTPPANDNFANAEILATDGTWLGTNIGATAETGEPTHVGISTTASVWFAWTAPADGWVSFDTFGSDYDTLLAMYVGDSVDALSFIAANDDAGPDVQSEIPDISVTAGMTYRVAVDGYSGATGQVTLNWSYFDGTDVTPPAITIITPANGSTYIQNSDVQAFYYCEDEPLGSGVASCSGPVPSNTLIDTSVPGLNTFTVTGTDNAGNTATLTASYTINPAPPAPANDNFANAEIIATDGTWLGTNIGATTQVGEPAHAGSGGASVWLQWTAPTNGYLTVDTFGSDYDTVLALYSGSAVDALTELASNDDSGGLQSLLANVPVISGTAYHIAVAGYLGATGQITLNVSFFDGTDTTPPTVTITVPTEGSIFVENGIVPAEYSCADEPLGSGVGTCVGDVPTGSPINTSVPGAQVFSVTGTDVAGNATTETVNYTVSGTDVTLPIVTIASPLDGGTYSQGSSITAEFTCADEQFGTGIATCTGDVPNGTLIDTSVIGMATFTVTGIDNAGNSAVAVAAYTIIEALANDNFADAENLGPSGTLVSTNVGATRESGEPNHAMNSGGASVWFQWTAAIDGYLTVDTFGSDFDTLLAMYTGSSIGALSVLDQNDDTSGAQSRLLNVPVAAGTTYHIAVDGYFGATGMITLNWSFSEQFDTVAPNVTIWDPVDGIVLAQGAVDNSFYTCFDPFPSSGLASCVGDVPSGDPIDTSVPGTFVFSATGTDVAGNSTTVTATYTVVANPPNDDFVDAIVLATEGATTGTNAGATKEPNEPNHHGNVGGTSVWFQWTAPVDGFVNVDTFGSDFDTILALYTGTAVDALTPVASNGDYLGQQSQLTNVPVVGGTTYSIALTGFVYATGNYTMTWSFIELNDLTPPEVLLIEPTDGAILFEGVTVHAEYYCFDEYLGSDIASCVGNVPSGDPIDTAVTGAYTFTVTGTDNAGNVTVTNAAYTVQAFTNDDFANALPIAITGAGGLIATNVGATKEPGEPDHAGDPGGASVWFQWTATEEGFLVIDTFDSDFDTTLAVYTGSSLGTLSEVDANNNASSFQSEVADIRVTVGETYYIAVDGVADESGQIDLNWLLYDGPAFIEVTPTLDPLWNTDADHDFWLNAAAPADVDGDGDLDLAVMGYFVEYHVSAEDKLVVFMNEGPDLDGNWIFTPQEVPLNGLYAGEVDLAWGDFDSDGDPDLAVAAEGATELYRNDEGVLVPIETVLPGYYEDSNYTGAYDLRSITWADYDNDGDPDLLIPSTFDFDLFEWTTTLMRNDGDDGLGGWTFTDSGIVLDGTIHAHTAWADNDNDGDLDLFMANVDNFTDNSFVRTYRNDGGVFTSDEPVGTLGVEHGLADWGDYDSDGDLDILVVGNIRETTGNYTTVLRIYDNEAGVFVPNTLIQSSFFPWLDMFAATWADYDSDGDVDILLTGSEIGPDNIDGKSQVLVNDSGTFTPLLRDLPAPISSIGNGGSFTWFDVDGDGDLDYFVAGAYWVPNGNNSVESQLHLYRNDSLVPNTAPLPPSGLRSTVSGDSVDLGWDPAVDDATATAAITYQLDVRPQSSVAGAVAERKRLPEPGNISAVANWSLQGLAPGIYTWMLQAVDSAFNGSIASEGTFNIGGVADTDGDGIADVSDNCTEQVNPAQQDTDGDGYGNRCDPDFNNDGVVNFLDMAHIAGLFLSTDPTADLNGDGVVNFMDYPIASDYFLLPPGPSGVVP